MTFFKSNQTDFKKSLAISLTVHAFLALFFLIKTFFFNKPYIDLSQAISVSMGPIPAKVETKAPAEPATQVAPIEEADPQPQPIAEEPKEEAKPKEQPVVEKKKTPVEKVEPVKKEDSKKISLEKTKKEVEKKDIKKNLTKQKEALAKLKKLSALDKIKQDLKTESLNKIKGASKSNTVKSSSVIAAGTELRGLDKIQADDYLSTLDGSIKTNWTLPQWLISKKLKAQVLVKINPNGEILSSKVISSSGNPTYDQYCLSAVEKSAPFASVPNKFSAKFSLDGIVIGFPE